MAGFNDWISSEDNRNELQPKDDFSTWINSAEQEQNNATQVSMDEAVKADPERQARINKMETRTGLPEKFIDQNLDDLELQTKQKDFDAVSFRKNSPKVAKFLADPANAKLSHDDVSNLAGFEWLMKAPVEAYEEGSKQVQAAKLNYKEMTDGLSDNEKNTLKRLESTGPSDYGASNWIQSALIETSKMAPSIIDYVNAGLEGAIPGALAAGGTAFLAGGETPVGLVTVPSAALTGAGFGFTASSTLNNVKMNTGMAYQEFKNFKDKNGQPLDPQVAGVASLVAGTINAGIDTISLGKLADTIPGISKLKSMGGNAIVREALKNPTVVDSLKNFASRYGTSVTAQTLLQTGKTLVQGIVGEAAKQYQGNFDGPDKAQMMDKVLHAADTSFKVSALLSLPGPTLNFMGDYMKSRQAKTNVENIRNLNTLAQNSKTLKRAPEKLKQLLASLKEGSTIQNIYIPAGQWRDLFQSQKLDPEAVADKVTTDGGKQYREAIATGADIVIPVEDYAANLAGSKFGDPLLDDIRLDPEQMTNREANAWDAEHEERANNAIQKAGELFSRKDPTQFIYDSVRRQIKQTGAADTEASAQASQMQSVFRTLASRTGIAPKELWNRYGPQIRRELPDDLKNAAGDYDVVLDPIINRIRKGEIPTEEEIRGESLINRLRRTGIYDEGGELSARDVDKDLKLFQRRLSIPIEQEGGYTLDEAAQVMADEGYLNADRSQVGQDELLDAIDREMSGSPVYASENYNAEAAKQADILNSLNDYLNDSNIDLNNYTNEELKALLTAPADEDQYFNIVNKRSVEEVSKKRDVNYPDITESTIKDWDHLQSPWLLADGTIIGTNGDHIALSGEFGYEGYNDFSNDTGAIRAGFWDDNQGSGKFSVFLQAPESGITQQQFNTVEKFYNNHNGNVDIAYSETGKADPMETKQKQEITIDELKSKINKSFNQEERGKLSIGGEGYTIKMFQGADPSTVLHESGHLYLEILNDLNDSGKLPESMADDLQTVRDWVGNKGGSFTTEQHEQFARGFENYLREGNAPTIQLRHAFAKFRAWLVQLYKNAKELNAPLNDSVRGVFDRLLATDEEISNAQEVQNFQRMWETAEDAGMTEKQFEAYKQTIADSKADAESQIARTNFRELEKQRKGATKKVTDEVFGEISQRPVYQTISFLRRGKLYGKELPEGMQHIRLSKERLVELKGKDFLKELPRGLYQKEGGADPEDIAMFMGYTSGDEMLQDIVSAPKLEDAVSGEVQARMKAKYGDVFTDGTLAEKAMRATHNADRGKVISMELKALARRSSKAGRPAPGEVMKAAAENIINKKRLADTHSKLYLAAERRAANDAQQAAARGDIDAAAEAKEKQQMNYYLYRAALAAEERAESNRNRLYTMGGKTYQAALGKAGDDYLDAVNQLLEKTDFRRISLEQIRRRKALGQFIEEQTNNGIELDIPDELVYAAGLQNYRDMTNEQLQNLRDSVDSIYHVAKFKDKLLDNKTKKDFYQQVDQIVGDIVGANNAATKPQVHVKTKWQKVSSAGKKFAAMHTKMEFLFEMLDGKKNGYLHKYVFQKIADAEDAELEMMTEYRNKYQEIMNDYTGRERAGWYTKARHIEGIGRFNKARAMALGLNWGNEGNRQAVLDGFFKNDGTKWTEDDVGRIFDTFLDKKDWDNIQKIWDMIDELWPHIESLQKDLTGLAPEKVKSSTVNTNFGDYRGGYFPLKFDKEMSWKAMKYDNADAAKSADQLFGPSFFKPATAKGHTKERVGSGGLPVRLDLGVVGDHLNQVIHDISFRKAIIDADKLTSNKQVQEAITNSVGLEMYSQIRPWLAAIAGENHTTFSGWEKIMSRARTGATIVNMGFKVTTAISQLTGLIQSAAEEGPDVIYEGLKFWARPDKWKETANYVMDKSVMMKYRRGNFDRDVKNSIDKMLKKNGVVSNIEQSFFYFTGMLDMGVAIPTWTAAYKHAMNGTIKNIKAGDEESAIHYADRTVRVTQSAGSVKDLAQIQLGSEMFKLYTMFYSYMNGVYNQFQKYGYDLKLGRMSTPQFLATMGYMWLAPALLSELVAGRGPSQQDNGDKESWAHWATKKALIYPFDSIVGVRDLMDAATSHWDYQASPAFDAFATAVKSSKAIGESVLDDKEFSRSDVKNTLMAASYWGHLPGRQAWITGSYMYDLMTGNAHPENALEFMHDMAFSRQGNK